MPWNPSPKLLTHSLFQLVNDQNSPEGRQARAEQEQEVAHQLRRLRTLYANALLACGGSPATIDKTYNAFAQLLVDRKIQLATILSIKADGGIDNWQILMNTGCTENGRYSCRVDKQGCRDLTVDSY